MNSLRTLKNTLKISIIHYLNLQVILVFTLETLLNPV